MASHDFSQSISVGEAIKIDVRSIRLLKYVYYCFENDRTQLSISHMCLL